MMRVFAGSVLLGVLCSPVFAQGAAATATSAADPVMAFEVADVHVSPHRAFPFSDGGSLHGDRYVLRQMTMLDLIAKAYGLDPSNVQGGPSWLEMDRFDIVAKASPKTTQKGLALMLRPLLKERFHLVAHTGSAPMPAYVLKVPTGTKPKLTESDGAGAAACDPSTDPPNPKNYNEPFYIVAKCHNISMETFADVLRQFAGGYLTKPVVDLTGLKGTWDFDFKWSPAGLVKKAGADGISIFDAMDKQLGLKLALETAPRPVMMVDSVDRVPTANVAGTEKLLPTPPPMQFEVATIKPSRPDEPPHGSFAGGQVNLQNLPLKLLVTFAWDLNPGDDEMLVGAPKWLDSAKWDILAKAPSEALSNTGPGRPPIDIEDLRQMVQGLLADRFEMKTHMEDRPITAYTLTAPNPKLKKADPTSRTRCTEGPGPEGKDPRIASPVLNRLRTCQNMTMAQIGEEFQRMGNGVIFSPVLDKTGLTGSYDFTLSFSSSDLVKGSAAASGDAANGTASEPNGALSFVDAVNKQLGLKLEKEKRPAPVLVIDHMDETPTAN